MAETRPPTKYGLLDGPQCVRIRTLMQAIDAYHRSGRAPFTALQPGASPVLFAVYVGDPSEVGPRGGLRRPAFCVALHDAQMNLDAGLTEEQIDEISFPTLRNQIYLITFSYVHQDFDRIYRFDTALGAISGMLLDSPDPAVRTRLVTAGERPGSDWLKRCGKRIAFGNRDDYRLSEDPTVFQRCSERFNILHQDMVNRAACTPATKRRGKGQSILDRLAPDGLFTPEHDRDAALRGHFCVTRSFIELVPQTSWFSNLRSCMPASKWDKISQEVRSRARFTCCTCGARPERKHLDAHEEWAYDDAHHVQSLVRVVCLCSACHEVRHFSRASSLGRGVAVLQRLAALNGWSARHAEEYSRECMALWQQRSEFDWSADITWLKRSGLMAADEFDSLFSRHAAAVTAVSAA